MEVFFFKKKTLVIIYVSGITFKGIYVILIFIIVYAPAMLTHVGTAGLWWLSSCSYYGQS